MSIKHYLKFQIPFGVIHNYLKQSKFQNIIFYIDLPSISRGFYNKNVVQYEIAEYIRTQKTPSIFINELREFMNNLYSQYKKYNVKFFIFYDDGQCLQNKNLYNDYKNRTSSFDSMLLEDHEEQLFRQIREYYYSEVPNRFNISNLSKALYIKKYEADFIPYVVLKENILDSQNFNTLNVILSTDKDLLQCCQFKNVLQIMTLYSKKNSSIEFNVYNDENAIEQIYKNFQRGILTSKYIPMILAISGDKADKIPGVPNIGEAKAYKLIVNNNIPDFINESSSLPVQLEDYRYLIIRNYKLISFEEQIKRLPFADYENLKQVLTF
jgi:5'-3' exonuclease